MMLMFSYQLYVLMAIVVLLHVSFDVCVQRHRQCATVSVKCIPLPPVFASVWWCSCLSVCVAIDIDATDLDPEDNELPVNLRSPKASPNTVMSPLAKEKRMPFFKKVNPGLLHHLFFFCPSARLRLNAFGCTASLCACPVCQHHCPCHLACTHLLACMPFLNLSLSPLPSHHS